MRITELKEKIYDYFDDLIYEFKEFLFNRIFLKDFYESKLHIVLMNTLDIVEYLKSDRENRKVAIDLYVINLIRDIDFINRTEKKLKIDRQYKFKWLNETVNEIKTYNTHDLDTLELVKKILEIAFEGRDNFFFIIEDILSKIK